MVDLAAIWLVGVLAAIPVVMWWVRDVSAIPRSVWFWTGHRRRHWQWGVLLGWICGGWLAMVTVLVWWRSVERKELRAEAVEYRHDHERH